MWGLHVSRVWRVLKVAIHNFNCMMVFSRACIPRACIPGPRAVFDTYRVRFLIWALGGGGGPFQKKTFWAFLKRLVPWWNLNGQRIWFWWMSEAKCQFFWNGPVTVFINICHIVPTSLKHCCHHHFYMILIKNAWLCIMLIFCRASKQLIITIDAYEHVI